MSKQFPVTGNLIDELVYWEQNNGAPIYRAAIDKIERLEGALRQVPFGQAALDNIAEIDQLNSND